MITIYWTKDTLEPVHPVNKIDSIGLRSRGPVPVKDIVDNKNKLEYKRCPAFKDYITNLYSISAPFDYSLFVDDNNYIRTNDYDQKLFDQFVYIRSLEDKLISLNDRHLFIPDVDDLMITQMHPHLDTNGFSDNTSIIPGTFNIAKWPRFIECAFHMKNNKMYFKQDDPLFYLKFHTNEKIVFKYFMMTPSMVSYQLLMLKTKDYKNKMSPLSYFYDLFASKPKLKAKMLKEAMDNALE